MLNLRICKKGSNKERRMIEIDGRVKVDRLIKEEAKVMRMRILRVKMRIKTLMMNQTEKLQELSI